MTTKAKKNYTDFKFKKDDLFTSDLKNSFTEWYDVSDHNDKDLSDFIYSKKVHYLIDLAGYSTGNRLQVFKNKPAPVQISWLGYCNDTHIDEIDYIVRHKPRLFFVNKLLSPLKGNTLVLYQFVEKHGKPLYDLILNTYKDRKVFFVSGDVDALTREKIRAITEKSSNAIIVASYGTFSTGINIKNLHNIIFSSPSKSKIRVLQSVGRGLRLGDNKNE